MKTIALLVVGACIALAGCTSYQSVRKGGSAFGGGYDDEVVAPGLVILMGQSGNKPWRDFDAAWKVFYRRADELFGVGKYEVLLTKEDSFSPFDAPLPGQPKPLVSVARGFVLSKASPLSKEEALRLSHEYAKRSFLLAGMKEPNSERSAAP